jgi:hypothetical protein
MAMETFPNLMDPVYSINRYGIGAGKSRMLAPNFLAYGALRRFPVILDHSVIQYHREAL